MALKGQEIPPESWPGPGLRLVIFKGCFASLQGTGPVKLTPGQGPAFTTLP